jgi:hypothetical protein
MQLSVSIADPSVAAIDLSTQLELIHLSLLSLGLCRALAPDDIKHKNRQRSQEQQVNQVRGDKAAKIPNQP